MWRKIFVSGSLVVVVALARSTSGFAQNETREWQATLSVGGSFAPKGEFRTGLSGSAQDTSRTVGMKFEPGYLFGFRITQNLGEQWAADLEYSFANQRVRFTNLAPTIQDLQLSHQIHHFSYNVSFLQRPREKRFRYYGDVGIGTSLFWITGGGKNDAADVGLLLRDSWEFVFNAGGGFKYVVRDPYVLTIDVKDHMSRWPSYGLPSSASIVNNQFQPGMAIHGILHNWQISAGFTYQWDEP